MDLIFETSRLIIREFQLADFETIHSYASQATVVQYQNWGPNSPEETQAFIAQSIAAQHSKPRLTYELAVVLKENSRHIGGCGIFVKDADFQLAHIGYIIHPIYWNRSFATESINGLLEYARSALNIKAIKATCDQRNIGSQKVLEKNGFQLEKIMKDDFIQKGTMRTTLLYNYI